jgi:hypothetical protein
MVEMIAPKVTTANRIVPTPIHPSAPQRRSTCEIHAVPYGLRHLAWVISESATAYPSLADAGNHHLGGILDPHEEPDTSGSVVGKLPLFVGEVLDWPLIRDPGLRPEAAETA